MNVLFYEFGINPLKGGVQRVSFNVATQLHIQGHNCYAAYFDNDDFSSLPSRAFDDVLKLNGLNDETYQRLKDYCQAHDIDVIINQNGSSVDDTRLLARIKAECGYKLYSFVHISPTGSRDVLGFRDIRFPKLVIRSIVKEIMYKIYPADKIKYKRIYEMSDRVVLLSESFIDNFVKMIGVQDSDNKLTAISNSISYPIQNTRVINGKEKIVLVVARMGETQKKLSRVLDCWKLISASLPEWRLIMVGDGSDLHAYKRIAEKSKLPRIIFTGTADPEPFYRKASIFLMTSATEGFGMTLLEAQQFGVVPIAMDTYKALHDIITDGYNGFITTKGSIDKLAEKVMLLASDNNLRQSLAENALQSVKRFSGNKIQEQWNKLLSNV